MVACRPGRGGGESGGHPLRSERDGSDGSTDKRKGDDARAGARVRIGAIMNDITEIKQLRVSVATYNRVLFQHPDDDTQMLALERQATVLEEGKVNVRAQPFGGGIHILNPTP